MPRQVDHEERRREVGEAALRIIARDGAAAASIRAIAGEAGMSTSWITHYFDDHTDVLFQAVDQIRDNFELCCEEARGLGPGEGLRAMLVGSVSAVEQATARRALLHLAAGPVPQPVRHAVAALERWCVDQLADQIDRVVKDGAVGSIDAQTAASDLHVLVLGLRFASMTDPDDWPIERLHDSVDRTLAAVLGPGAA